MKVSAAVLHEFLTMGANNICSGEKWIYDTYLDNIGDFDSARLNEDDFYALQKLDIKEIIADRGMSENHIGGDVVVAVVNDVLEAIKEGYEIITWYGPETEALIVGVKPGTIEVNQ